MAGHSQFKNIMHRKGAQDAKRAKVFTKIIRELTVSARTGLPDPEANPRLRSAMIAARVANMPKDTMERAIKRGAGGEDMTDYAEVRYEGYGPGGVAVVVEALTDNRNRTAAEVRSAFTKYGGSMGEAGSVSFQFQHVGMLSYDASKVSFDAVFETAIEAGALDVEEQDGTLNIYCEISDFHKIRDQLMPQTGEPQGAEIIWKPTNFTDLGEDAARTMLKLIDVLEDNDDVQKVFSNFQVAPDILEKLAQD